MTKLMAMRTGALQGLSHQHEYRRTPAPVTQTYIQVHSETCHTDSIQAHCRACHTNMGTGTLQGLSHQQRCVIPAIAILPQTQTWKEFRGSGCACGNHRRDGDV